MRGTTKTITRLTQGSICVLLAGTAISLVAACSGQAMAAGEKLSIEERKFIFEPWDPKNIDKRRKEFGLIGPGPQNAYPEPKFPRSLAKPNSIEEIMPNARATVRQTGGRSPLGLAEPGDN